MGIYIGVVITLALIEIVVLVMEMISGLRLKKEENVIVVAPNSFFIIPYFIAIIFVSVVMILLKTSYVKDSLSFDGFSLVFFFVYIGMTWWVLKRKIIIRDKEVIIVDIFWKQNYSVSEIQSFKKDDFGRGKGLYGKDNKRLFSTNPMMANEDKLVEFLKKNKVEVK